MAQFYVSGAVDIFVSTDTSKTPAFLGHCEKGPRVDFDAQWSPVFSDIGGQRVASEHCFDGEEARVTADLTRYNEAVYALIANKGDPFGGFTRGYTLPGELGSLAVLEGIAPRLWLRFSYGPKPAFNNVVSGSMVPGIRFLAVIPERDSWPELGTKARKISLSWKAVRVFDPTYVGTYGYGRWQLYDFDMNGLGAIN